MSNKKKTKLCNIICALLSLCILAVQFVPFWNYGEETISIGGFVWMDAQNDEVLEYFEKETNKEVPINSVAVISVVVTIFSALGAFLCIKNSEKALVTIVSSIAALFSIYGFLFKSFYRLGFLWYIHLILAILVLVAAGLTYLFYHKYKEEEDMGINFMSQRDIKTRVHMIKNLPLATTGKNKKVSMNEVNFNKIINFLNDDAPEIRIAACEVLSTTAKNVAFSHISYKLEYEQDEKVAAAMKDALSCIRKNLDEQHIERA